MHDTSLVLQETTCSIPHQPIYSFSPSSPSIPSSMIRKEGIIQDIIDILQINPRIPNPTSIRIINHEIPSEFMATDMTHVIYVCRFIMKAEKVRYVSVQDRCDEAASSIPVLVAADQDCWILYLMQGECRV